MTGVNYVPPDYLWRLTCLEFGRHGCLAGPRNDKNVKSKTKVKHKSFRKENVLKRGKNDDCVCSKDMDG